MVVSFLQLLIFAENYNNSMKNLSGRENFKRYLITTALPYANGPIHIGHLAGVYVPADIYVRYLRMNDADVVFIGGSDEHGVPITIKALQQGVSPQEIVD
jgi:methionyl-tRNA synthetase